MGLGWAGPCRTTPGRSKSELTLNTDVYVILRLLGLSCVFVGFGEGVCRTRNVSCATLNDSAIRFELGTRDRNGHAVIDCQTHEDVCAS